MTPAQARNIIIGTLAVLLGLALFDRATGQTRIEMVHGSRLVVLDGDTVTLSCEPKSGNRFSAQSTTNTCSERIRIYNIDAPEIGSARCAAERDMGIEARDALTRLLDQRSVTIHRCEPQPCEPKSGNRFSAESTANICSYRCTDRFGRTLARLETAAGDIGAAMIRAGKALPWQPGIAAHDARAAIFCGR